VGYGNHSSEFCGGTWGEQSHLRLARDVFL